MFATKVFCRMGGRKKFTDRGIREMKKTAAFRAADRNPYSWNIEGTDDLRPYIYGKSIMIKWGTTLVGYPVIAAILAGIMSFIF